MKVIVNKYLNVRVGAPSVNAPCYQYLAPGTELIVDGTLYKGDLYGEVDTWFKDEINNYYWSGGIQHSIGPDEFLNKSTSTPPNKAKARWFEHLKIEDIWNNYQTKGEGVKIALLDTGYNTIFTGIQDRIASNKIFITPQQYPGIELKVVDQSNDAHGTRCASILASSNKLDMLVGIAPAAQLLIGKISIDTEIRDFNTILNGIDWAVRQGADIISISYAQPLTKQEIPLFQSKLSQIVGTKNILLLAATGNCASPQVTEDRYPACFKEFISIGASDLKGNLSAITVLNGKTVIHAPGEKIEAYGNNKLPTVESGTSFSTPIIGGIAALAVAFLKKKHNGSWNCDSLIQEINQTGTQIVNQAGKKVINPTNLFKNL